MAMEWKEIRSEADVAELMRVAEGFHDWYLAGFQYDPLARAEDGSGNLARFVSETDALSVNLRQDCMDPKGEWPEIELEFMGVETMSFSSYFEPNPFYGLRLVPARRGWLLVDDECALTEEVLQSPWRADSSLAVHAAEVRWRRVRGMTRGDEVEARELIYFEASLDRLVAEVEKMGPGAVISTEGLARRMLPWAREGGYDDVIIDLDRELRALCAEKMLDVVFVDVERGE